MTLKHLFQPNCLDVVNHHINMLIKGCHSPKGLITEEEEEYSKLKVQTKKYPYPCIGRDLFEIEYGPVIMNLKTLTNSNDKTLKKMEKGLLHFFNGDGLLHRVTGIFRRNKKASKRAGAIMCEYYDYLDRFDNEISWLHGAGEQIEQIQGLLSGSPVLPELAELRAQGRDLKTRVLVLQKERPQNFKAHCEALDALANRWVDIDILSKKLISLTETAKDLCLRSKNLRILMIEKFKYADRFFSSEERLKIEGSKVCEELRDLMLEVEQAELSFNKKMNGLPQVGHTEMKYEQIILGKSKSWITRLLKGRHILGEMRIQGRDMCAFVSTVVMTESLNKSEAARRRVYSGLRFRLKEFGIKLSEHHLQDIVREYYANNKRTGRQKMNVCLERMIESGVVSETAYGTPDAAAMDSTRYHLSEFETLETGEFAKAFHKLDDAKVLVGIFGITKGYHSLGPHDIYDVPPNAFLETNAAGNKLTHAVVLVGYGVSPEGEAYYDYQNWNGPDWGKGGCGKVTCRSIQKMYSAKL